MPDQYPIFFYREPWVYCTGTLRVLPETALKSMAGWYGSSPGVPHLLIHCHSHKVLGLVERDKEGVQRPLDNVLVLGGRGVAACFENAWDNAGIGKWSEWIYSWRKTPVVGSVVADVLLVGRWWFLRVSSCYSYAYFFFFMKLEFSGGL